MRNPFETEERAAFRETVARFVRERLSPNAAAWDEAGEIPWWVHEEAGALGLFGFGIEERFGGLGTDDIFLRAISAEELSKAGASGINSAIGGRNISLMPIQSLATEEIKARALPEIVSGRKSSSLCISEPSGGSDVANLRTRAVRDGNEWVLTGEKTFITAGLKSDHFVVAARTGDRGLAGISLFFVDWGAEGFSRASVGPKQGWWCSDTATLRFDDVRLPADALMGEENRGFLSIMHNFNTERICMIAGCVGMMKRCYADALDWARQRETFGRRLIDNQVIAHKFADMSMRIDATEAYLWAICAGVAAGETPVAEVSKAKVFGSKSLEFVASECMQVMGGAGYLRGGAIERTWREVKVMAIGGGSEEIMRDLAARQMGLAA